MKELLLYVAQNLVDNPEEVDISEHDSNTEVLFEVRVADSDMGKIIGRQGRVVREIRTLLKSVAQRHGKKVTIDIVDN